MNTLFKIYLTLGVEHILDVQAYDHLLFLITLCVVYLLSDWRQVLILATAFTLGHSLTLGLSSANKISINSSWIEFLIPATIFLTAIFNLLFQKSSVNISRRNTLRYVTVLFFGLIHGLGFSNFFRSTLIPGQEDKFLWRLFSFNLGVEVGQVVIILVFLLVANVIVRRIGLPQKYWVVGWSSLALVASAIMMSMRIGV